MWGWQAEAPAPPGLSREMADVRRQARRPVLLPVQSKAELNDAFLQDRAGRLKERRCRLRHSQGIHRDGGVQGRDVLPVEQVVDLGDELGLQVLPQREEGPGVAQVELVD